MNDEGVELYKRGDYRKAENLHRTALSFQRKRGEDNKSQSLSSKFLLGRTLMELYKFVESEDLIRQALEGRHKISKPDDEDMLETMNVLAIVLWYQSGDKAAEAEELFRELLFIWDRSSNPLNLSRLSVVSNIGLIEMSRADYPAAEKRYRTLHMDRQKLQGANHRDNLTCMLSLSMALGYQQLYEEAEVWNRKALDGLRLDPGPEHPTTILSQSTLANILTKRSKFNEAEALIRSAIAAREKVLGPDHLFTLKSMGRLSEICELQGRYEEALSIQETAYELCKQRLGQYNQETLGHEEGLLRIRSIVAAHKDDGQQKGEEQKAEIAF